MLWRRRMKCDQRAIEAALLVRLRDGFDIAAIEDRTFCRMDLREFASADIADEFDGHGRILKLQGLDQYSSQVSATV